MNRTAKRLFIFTGIGLATIVGLLALYPYTMSRAEREDVAFLLSRPAEMQWGDLLIRIPPSYHFVRSTESNLLAVTDSGTTGRLFFSVPDSAGRDAYAVLEAACEGRDSCQRDTVSTAVDSRVECLVAPLSDERVRSACRSRHSRVRAYYLGVAAGWQWARPIAESAFASNAGEPVAAPDVPRR
jgi:hypothetical protein